MWAVLSLAIGLRAAAPSSTAAPIPRDNSYTLESAFEKYRKNYPQITPRRYLAEGGTLRKKGLVYTTVGERCLHLDLFRVSEDPPSPLPIIILVHGGGWRSGDRSLMYPLADYLAKQGFTALAVEYRLSPEALYPAAVEDLRLAAQWARDHGRDFGGDPARLILLGCSAGGQLAALVALTETEPVTALINIDGVMDFTSEEARRHEDNPSKEVTAAGLWFGGRYAEKEALWREASPIHHVNESSPPILFINSSQPRFHVGRNEVIALLDQHGIAHQVHEFADAPHSFWLFDPWFEPTGQWILEFLQQTLYGGNGTPSSTPQNGGPTRI